ncbi:MAG: HlyD family efflux transporter periplasmic adaptor subunit [Flavobacteriales bacterium]
MLQISNNESINAKVNTDDLQSFKEINLSPEKSIFKRWLIIFMLAIIVVLLLPWTQNIQSVGYLTALNPEQRPQMVNSVIAGQINKWFVQEGDFVKKGDTIMFITEVKDDYFDPNLLDNVDQQIKAKESSVVSYMEKVRALDSQVDALLANKKLKIQQTENKLKQAYLKVKSDSIEFLAATNNLVVAEEQLKRYEELYSKDLISKTEFESRKVSLQNANAKAIDAENKLLISKNEILVAQAELNTVENDFKDKISKAESEKYASLSSMYDAEAQVSKLQNSYANYDARSGFYYITAPQDGFVTKAVQTGIGETIKEGDPVVSIIPAKIAMAVEMYVDPVDLPLVNKGQKVRFIFDGFPAFVFSGWPNSSFGTFGGEVYAIDNFISPNGKYRMLVTPDQDDLPWPPGLRVGTGANGMALLQDVPIWYELWRKLNGFPPNFYTGTNGESAGADSENDKK